MAWHLVRWSILKPAIRPARRTMSSIDQAFLWGSGLTILSARRYSRSRPCTSGRVALVLAIIAWVKRRQLRHPELADIAILVAAAGFVLSLGINCTGWERWSFPCPGFCKPSCTVQACPCFTCRRITCSAICPFFQDAGDDAFLDCLRLIFSSLLAGLGAFVLTKSASSKVKRWVGVLLLVLVFIDFYPGVLKGFSVTQARPVDTWLAANPTPVRWHNFPSLKSLIRVRCTIPWFIRNPSWAVISTPTRLNNTPAIEAPMTNFPSQDSVDLLRQLG